MRPLIPPRLPAPSPTALELAIKYMRHKHLFVRCQWYVYRMSDCAVPYELTDYNLPLQLFDTATLDGSFGQPCRCQLQPSNPGFAEDILAGATNISCIIVCCSAARTPYNTDCTPETPLLKNAQLNSPVSRHRDRRQCRSPRRNSYLKPPINSARSCYATWAGAKTES